MIKRYSGLWTLLVMAFAVIAVASCFDGITVLGHEFRTADIVGRLTRPQNPDAPAAAADSVSPGTVPALPAEVDTTSQRILLIGDSMLEGLSPRLAAYAAANGHELSTVIWYSSTSQIWGDCDTLSTFIRRYKPTYVMVCLGANELFVTDIERKRDKYVKSILRQIGELPYVWIGPPNWKEDTGINRLVERNAAPGRFFLSNGMHFDRSSDGAHPTRRSAAAWMDSVARWMPAHCAHPIRLDQPSDTHAKARPRRVIVLQPKQ